MNDYISKEEWDQTKYVLKEVSTYVDNYLHHEGFLCLTDRKRYYLQSNSKAVYSLPQLNSINLNSDLRIFWVNDPLARGWDSIQIVTIAEKGFVETPLQINYSDIFQNILKIFQTKQEIKIYWDGAPPADLGEELEEEDLTKQEQEVAFVMPFPNAQMFPTAVSAKVGQIRVIANKRYDKVSVLKLDRVSGLAHLHMAQEEAHLLERCNVFLLVKEKLFYMSPLNIILDLGLGEIPRVYFTKK
jgi:hypothetical protein